MVFGEGGWGRNALRRTGIDDPESTMISTTSTALTQNHYIATFLLTDDIRQTHNWPQPN